MMAAPPPTSPLRLDGLDIARFAAFVGMVIVNFAIVMGVEEIGGSGLWVIVALEGKAAASFVVLAGIGLGLAGEKGAHGTIAVTLRRALFLLVLGLVNMLIFDADILHYYAFYFVFGVIVLPLRTPALVALIVALTLGFVALLFMLDYDRGWDWMDYSYSGFWTPAGFVRNLFFNGWHPVVPWLGFLLFGIVLSRMPLSTRRTQIKLAVLGAAGLALAQTASVGLRSALAGEDPELLELLTTAPVPPMPLYLLSGLGAASLLIGLCLLLTQPLEHLRLLSVLQPAGRQTLTLYIAHILIGMGVLEALGLLGGQNAGAALAASAVFCLTATLFAFLWSKRFRRGPIESAMRAIAG